LESVPMRGWPPAPLDPMKFPLTLAGHSSIRTTAVYVEANPRRLARILQDVTW
jgi:hypothetical protein